MKTREIGFPPGMAGGLAALLWRLQVWWGDQPGNVRTSIWAGSAAMLAIVGLLLMFHQTVRASAEQAELRHAAMRHQGDAARRCNTLRGQRLRDACLQQLATAPAAVAPAQTPDGKLVTTVAQTRR